MDNQNINLPMQPKSALGLGGKLPMVIIVSAAVVLLLGGMVAWSFFGMGQPKQQITSAPAPKQQAVSLKTSTDSGKVVKSVKEIELPFRLDDPTIFRASLVYIFETRIREIRKNAEGNTSIFTDGNASGVTKFRLTNATHIDFRNGDNTIPASISDLKMNQQVRIYVDYNLKRELSHVPQVVILSDKPTATSSAGTR